MLSLSFLSTFLLKHLSYSNASILSCLFCSILIFIYIWRANLTTQEGVTYLSIIVILQLYMYDESVYICTVHVCTLYWCHNLFTCINFLRGSLFVTMYNNLIIHGITTYCYYRQIIVMLINIQPHLIFVLYLCSVTSQSLSLSRDCQRASTILTSRAASRHKNLHVKSPEQPDRVTRLMCVGSELE